MSTINYVELGAVQPDDFILLLNNPTLREHLIAHDMFDADSVNAWIKTKIKVDATRGCRVRAIVINDQLVGWCGIQLEGERYEIALVIDKKAWGLGKKIFLEIFQWAKLLGHDEVFIHFLHTRPKYQFLRRISTRTYESEFLGNKFTTYQLAVNKPLTWS